MSSGPGSWRSAWLPVGLWLLVIFGASTIPNLQVPQVGLRVTDKFAHLGEYGVLGLLFARARRPARAGWAAVLAGALCGLAVGGLDEIYQRGTPGRDASLLDVAADVCGAALGAWAWSRWVARGHRPRPRDGET